MDPSHTRTVVTAGQVAGNVRRVLSGESGFAGRILSVYLYGSLLWGGFDIRSSDVDLIVVISNRRIESYGDVRLFARRMPTWYTLDISTSTIDEVGLPVACRPYILNSAADHGWLVHGSATLPRGRPLDKRELTQALRFNARQLSRNYAGLVDERWAYILSRQVKSHLVQLSQLVHSLRPGVPFAGKFEVALEQAASLFPRIRRHQHVFIDAVRPEGRELRLESMMRAILCLDELVSSDTFPYGDLSTAAELAP